MPPDAETLALIKSLESDLEKQAAACVKRDDWYSGEHPVPALTGSSKATEAYKALLDEARSNWCEIVVDAVEERLAVIGFRFGAQATETNDLDVWRSIWQTNGLDAGQITAHREALIHGFCPVLVWPGEDGAMPTVSIEDPQQVVVKYESRARRRRVAALKVWTDGDTKTWVLYRPDRVEWWVSQKSADPARAELDEEQSGPNPLGVVPIVELENKTRVGKPPKAEISTTVISIQKRINRTLFGRMLATEFAAFRQRWATGMEIPEDENGDQVEPFKAAVDRLWISEDPDTKFGEFSESDLNGYIRAIEADVQHLAAVTHTPPHYVLGNMVNISGDALKAAEAGLISKCRSRQTTFGERWEEIIRLALKAVDDKRADDQSCAVVWRDPEYRTEGELVDALVKMASLGVPRSVLWSRWGATPTDIERWTLESAKADTTPVDPATDPVSTDPTQDPNL
jgi:hypothetical protein